MDCCELNFFFLSTRINYKRIATCASFAVYHFSPGFLFEAKNVFLRSFFPLLLLTPRQQQWKFPFERAVLWRHYTRLAASMLLPKHPRNITFFLVTSDSNLELILWLHGSFQLQTILTTKRDEGPRLNKDKCNYPSTARTNAQNGYIWVFGWCTFVAVRHSRIEWTRPIRMHCTCTLIRTKSRL